MIRERGGEHTRRAAASAVTVGDGAFGRYGTAIEHFTGIVTREVLCDPVRDSAGLVGQLLALCERSPEIAVLVLAHCAPERAPAMRMIADVPVVPVSDVVAVGLAAATVTALNRSGRAPAHSRVVIAGASAMPALCPLLIGVGVGDITSWNLEDATTCSLMSIAAHADVVINLLARAPGLSSVCAAHSDPVVLTPEPLDPLSVLPGLTRALVEMPATDHTVYRDRYDEVLLACVFALVMAAPPGRPRPPGPSGALAARIADAATRALHPTPPTIPRP
ncbi:malate dehydrogenase (oxaloacetate-decarboxylating) [Pseudonocardia eucalypti]|nr:malate dehydrogenase (oxaloacetate-decarboxylating) [Pseudonocardia eucalypti]